MVEELGACPSPWGVPIAVGECHACYGAISVTLRARPPIALPAGPGQPGPPPPACCACPHCGVPLYPALSAVGPIAMAPKRDATALLPRTAPEPKDRRLAPTQRLELPDR